MTKPAIDLRSLASLILSAILIGLLLPAFLITLVRLFGWESFHLVMLIETFTPFIVVGALGALLIAGLARRLEIVWVALAILPMLLIWTVPELLHGKSLATYKRTSEFNLVIYDQNVLGAHNPTLQKLSQNIIESNADLVFLQESGRNVFAQLKSDRVVDRYPFSYSKGEHTLLSRYQISGTQLVGKGNARTLRSTVNVNGQDVTIYNVHMPAPHLVEPQRWLSAFDELKGELASQNGPVLAIGDFNATYSHKQFRELLQLGYTEAHMELGRGYARTWPANSVGGFMRIDHVLTHGSIDPVSIAEGDGDGSDHRSVIARVQYHYRDQ